MAQQLAAVHGHARLDWVMVLDPLATEVLPCWQGLAHHVEAPQQGQSPIAEGQMLRVMACRCNARSTVLGLWSCEQEGNTGSCSQGRRRCGLSSSRDQTPVTFSRGLGWVSSLLQRSAVGFCSIRLARGSSAFKVPLRQWRVERWQSPVDCARLEIV